MNENLSSYQKIGKWDVGLVITIATVKVNIPLWLRAWVLEPDYLGKDFVLFISSFEILRNVFNLS